jgi:hypothetical protein
MAVVETIKIEGDASGAVNAFNKTTDAAKKTGTAAKESNKTIESGLSAIDKRTGGAVSAFKGLTGGLKSAVGGFKTLRGAVIATGIGALLIAITSLVAYFTKTEKGAQTLRVIMAALGQVLAKVMDVAVGIGESLVNAFSNPQKALKDFANLLKDNIINRLTGLMELLPSLGKAINLVFSGKFKEAGKVATNAVAKVALGVEDVTAKVGDMVNGIKAFGTAIAESTMAAALLESQLNAVKVAERQLTSERSKANKEIIKARLIADDITKSTEERSAAILEAGRLEQEVSDKELRTQRERLRILEAQAALSSSNEETLNEIENARARVYDLEGANLSRRKRLQTEIIALKQEELTIEREMAKARQDSIKGITDKTQKELKDSVKKETDIIAKGQTNVSNRIQRTNAAIASSATEAVEFQSASLGDYANFAVANLDVVSGAIGNLSQAVGQNTKFGKSLAIAQAIIDTFKGANTALGSAPPPFNFIAAAGVTAAGIANVKAIKNTQIPTSASSSVSIPSISQPSASPQFNVVGQGSVNQLAQSIGSQFNKPMRAYVVGGDVTTSQELERKRIKTATFG